MKTMKHFATREVIRVTDEEAVAIHARDPYEPKAWQFISKIEWKMNFRDADQIIGNRKH